ncbi:MAG: hypothetical protein WCP65_04285 [Bacteroidota bacterium]
MKRKIHVLVSWPKLPVLDFLLFVLGLITKLTGNLKFPNLPVTLIDVKKAYDRLMVAFPLRKKGDIEKKEFEDSYDELNNFVHLLAGHVNVIADGNETLIVSTGFEASKGNYSPAVIPAAPGPVTLSQASGGPLHIGIGKVPGADSYVVVVFLGIDYFLIEVKDNNIVLPPSSIRTLIITDATCNETVAGLVKEMHVYVQALSQNSAGKSAFGPLTDIIIN